VNVKHAFPLFSDSLIQKLTAEETTVIEEHVGREETETSVDAERHMF
jgi:hypothetical protein